jgi:hypothetical protein
MLHQRMNVLVLSFIGVVSGNASVASELQIEQRDEVPNSAEFGVVRCALSSAHGLVIESLHVNGQDGDDSIIPGRTRCLPFLVRLKTRGATIGPPVTASVEGAVDMEGHQSGQLLTFNLIASGGNARAFLGCAFDPGGNGQLIAKFLDDSDVEYTAVNQYQPCMDVLADLAGGDRRFKISENNSPFPQDRIFFNYHHFHNAVVDVN